MSWAEDNYNSAIINLVDAQFRALDYEDSLANLDLLWKQLDQKIDEKGSLWILARNLYDQELLAVPFDLAHRIRSLTRFRLRDIWTVYRELPSPDSKFLAPAHFLVLFMVKRTNTYYFDKDSIREPHVFKDLEWGKRKVGKSGYSNKMKKRYSSKGRDPGNVFYKTSRNSEGYVIAVNGYTDNEVYEKLLRVSTRKGWVVASNVSDPSFKNLVERLGRRLVHLEMTK